VRRDGKGSEDDVERKAVAHQKNLNREVDVDSRGKFGGVKVSDIN
jgi:hypothetical protein